MSPLGPSHEYVDGHSLSKTYVKSHLTYAQLPGMLPAPLHVSSTPHTKYATISSTMYTWCEQMLIYLIATGTPHCFVANN